jgi:hypothetical protein
VPVLATAGLAVDAFYRRGTNVNWGRNAGGGMAGNPEQGKTLLRAAEMAESGIDTRLE